MGCSEGIPDPWLVDVNFNCSPAYVITQADIDAGAVNNSVRWVDILLPYFARSIHIPESTRFSVGLGLQFCQARR